MKNNVKSIACGLLAAVVLCAGCAREETPEQTAPTTQPATQQENKTQYAYTYDDAGRILEKIRYDGGVEQSRDTYRYDEKGRVLEEVAYRDGIELNRICYTFDAAGHTTELVCYWEGIEKNRDVYIFNDMGNLLESEKYVDGELRDWKKLTYNPEGLLQREEFPDGVYTLEYEFGDRGIVTEKRRYLVQEEPVIDLIVRYDSMLNIVEQIQYIDGDVSIRDAYIYQEDLVLRQEHFVGTTLATLREYTYVDHRKATEKYTVYNAAGGEFVEYMEYDGNENLTLTSYVQNGVEQSRISCAYDPAGNRILKVHVEDGTETERHEWSFDGNGNLSAQSYFSKGVRLSHDVFAYDGDGNMASRVHYDGDTAERWIYVYDHHGNLVEESISKVN